MSRMAEDASVALNRAASETASGFYFLGSAGLSAAEQMQSFNDVVGMARAMTIDTGQAAEGLVDVMRGFNITFDHSTEVADTLVKTIITSNQVFSDLDKAMSYVSSTADLTNNSLSDITAMLGVMANAGIKGSYAGTGLRRSFTNLMSPTSKMRELLRDLNISIYDNNHVIKPYLQVMGELSDRLSLATDEYKNMVFEVLFGRRAIAGQIKLFDVGSEALAAYSDELDNAAGTMQNVVDKQMAALLNQLGRIWQMTRRLARSIGEALAPSVRELADIIAPYLANLEAWIHANASLVKQAALITAEIGLFSVALGGVLLVLPNIVTSIGLLYSALTGLVIPIAAAVASFYAMRAIFGLSINDMIDTLNKFSTGFTTWMNKIPEDFRLILNQLVTDAKSAFNMVLDGWVKLVQVIMALGGGVLGIFNLDEVRDLVVEIGRAAPENYFDTLGDSVRVLGTNMKRLALDDLELLRVKLTEMFPDLADFITQLTTAMKGAGVGLNLPGVPSAPTGRKRSYVDDNLSVWKNSIKSVVESLDTLADVYDELLTGIVDGWSDAFYNLTQEGGNFSDFMSDMFNAVYQSFAQMVARMAAQRMFWAVFGEYALRPPRGRAGGIPAAIPLTPAQPVHEVMAAELATLPGGGSPKIAIAIDNTGPPIDLSVTSTDFDGETLVLNAAMKLAATDTNFRRTFVNGRR